MTPEQYEELRSLYFSVADLDPQARTPVLDKACRDRPGLRMKIEELLRDTCNPTAKLSDALCNVDDNTDAASETASSVADDFPRQFGSYRLVAKLGQGGMGTVYEAEQDNPRRSVALKVIRAGAGSRTAQRRFQREAQVLGRLQHRCIAQVYEASTVDVGSGPQPYFAMELVRGVALIDYADAKRLSTRDRLALMIGIGEAVHHAHQKGVIHRDLKPDNILVDANGVPKVLDFGIALITDADAEATVLTTAGGRLIGTIPYMSPEQVSGRRDDVDTRSDIHALGVILFQLLSGRLPYDVKGLMMHEAIRTIREDEPSRLGSIDSNLRGDIDAIVTKATEKDPERRYQSARDLTTDVRYYLENRPIRARPPSNVYRLKKFVRRNRIGVSAGVIVALSLIAATAVSIVFAVGESKQRRIADDARDRLQIVADFQSSVLGGIDAAGFGRTMVVDFREGIQSKLTSQGVDQEQIEAAVASFDELTSKVNATDIALRIVDEEILAGAVETIEEEFGDKPLLEAALRYSIGKTYLELGMYPKSLAQLQKALDIRDRELGGDHPDTLTSKERIGEIIFYLGKYAEAEPYIRDALKARRRVLGDDHPDTLSSIIRMCYFLEWQGKYLEALPYCREAMDGRRKVLGNDHMDTRSSIASMGTLLLSMGEYNEALSHFREALEGHQRILGQDHPRTLNAMHDMGYIFTKMRNYREASAYYIKAVDGRRRVLGNNHPSTLTTINNIGNLYLSMRKLEEALPYYQEALDGNRRLNGNSHPNTITSIHNMGTLLQSMGKLAEAEPYNREALQGCRQELGDDHPDTLNAIHSMGTLLESMGKLEEAESLYREALESKRHVLGDDHPSTLLSIDKIGRLLKSMGKHTEALPYHREALERRQQVLGNDHPDTLTFSNDTGDLLMDMGKFEEALQSVRKAMEGGRRALGDDHPITLRSISTLAAILRSMSKLEKAESYAREAMEGRRRVLGDDHPDTLTSINNMGYLLNSLGKHEDAVELLRSGESAARKTWAGADNRWLGNYLAKLGDAEGHTGRFAEGEATLLEAHRLLAKGFGADHARTTACVDRLVTLYQSWHSAKPGQGYDTKSTEWREKLSLVPTE